jgi:superfamily II DNA/RNA helicase
MIFTRTKRSAQKVADELIERGFAAAAVHGDLGQGAREQALRAFRSGKVDVLVATDVAARGLDVEGVTHVVNYQAPDDEMTYVHRIGRTARAGASGKSITLVDWDDLPRWKLICDTLALPMHEPPETYSNSPHLYLELDIPETAGPRLPSANRTRAGLGAEEVENLGGRDTSQAHPARERSGGRSSGGSGSGSSRAGERSHPERTEPATRSSRTRQRTRGGSGGTSTASSTGEGTGNTSPSASNTGPSDDGAAKRPRRRRRRGAGAAGASDAPATGGSEQS